MESGAVIFLRKMFVRRGLRPVQRDLRPVPKSRKVQTRLLVVRQAYGVSRD